MAKYKIPEWCKFPPCYHEDGIGGCWGISGGYVEERGEKYCKKCEYHKDSKTLPNTIRKLVEKKTKEG